MVVILSFENGTKKIVDLDAGSRPEDIAERNGAAFFDLCGSRSEANYRVAADPTGKADSVSV